MRALSHVVSMSGLCIRLLVMGVVLVVMLIGVSPRMAAAGGQQGSWECGLAQTAATPSLCAAVDLGTPSGTWGATASVTGPDGMIYVIGGTDGNGTYYKNVFAYDPRSGYWHCSTAAAGCNFTDLPALPLNLASASAVVTGGAIYVLGGQADPSTISEGVYKYTPGATSWQGVATMPVALWNMGAAVGSDGLIYTFGGAGPGDTLGAQANRVQAYNPNSGKWYCSFSASGCSSASLPPLPQGLQGPAAVTAGDGTIYVVGGYIGGGITTAAVETFSPGSSAGTGSFGSAPSLSYARFEESAVLGPDARIYVLGGRPDVTTSPIPTVSQVEAYTPGGTSWATVTTMPTPRMGMAAGLGPDGRIYAFGGFAASAAISSTPYAEAYDPGQWSVAKRLGNATPGAAAAIGSTSGTADVLSSSSGNLEEYSDNTSGTWQYTSAMPTSRANGALAANSSGTMYAVGGDTPNTTNPVAEVDYLPPATTTWSALATGLPTPRAYLAAVYCCQSLNPAGLFTFGGTTGTSPSSGTTDYVEEYVNQIGWACSTDDPSSSCSFKSIPPMPQALSGMAAAVGPDGAIYILGGVPSGSTGAVSTVYKFTPNNSTGGSWTQLASMPTARSQLAATFGPDGKLYAIGGEVPSCSFICLPNPLGTVEVYDPSTNSWSTGPSLTTPRYGLAAVSMNGKVYALGGTLYSANGSYAATNTVESFNPSSTTAARVASFRVKVSHGRLMASWKVVDRTGVAGFDLIAHGKRVNRRMLAVHAGTRYSYRLRAMAKGPYALEVVLTSGRVLRIPAG